MTMTNSWFPNKFAEDIWRKKYAGKYAEGLKVKEYFKDMATTVALGDKELEKKFFDILFGKKFSPGGRILAWIGRPNSKVSLMNCTTHSIEEDTIEAIADTTYSVMRASSRGQGIGINLSKLRPANAPVNNSAITSTGSISFMELINHAGGIIGQQGRRAALLFSLDIDHPDLWRPENLDLECTNCSGKGCMRCRGKGKFPYDFLNVKKVAGKIENANISVNISDVFMQAVDDDAMWEMKFSGDSDGESFSDSSKVPARALFNALASSAFVSAEPGVLFTDNTVKYSNSDLFGKRWKVVGVNACTEQLLDQDGVCNLGSMNLAAYVENAFTGAASFDSESFMEDVDTAIRFLDNVIDIEVKRGFSISDSQRESLVFLRRIGLGVMGYADTLTMMNLQYTHDAPTITFTKRIFSMLRDSSYLASIAVGKEKGKALAWHTTPGLDTKSIVSGGFFKTLPAKIKEYIIEYGTRNITTMCIAPTGSISNLYGVSSGIEPLFALEYTRRTRMNGHEEYVNYVHPSVQRSRDLKLPDNIWKTAYEVTPVDHVMIQALIQNYVDQSISKTTNLPETATVEDVATVYKLAHEMGLKGMAVYVNGSRDKQILYEATQCPECEDGGNVIEEGSCKTCVACGWSMCT
jgi:ribonucleoside-diphosphate reductase alpha chain